MEKKDVMGKPLGDDEMEAVTGGSFAGTAEPMEAGEYVQVWRGEQWCLARVVYASPIGDCLVELGYFSDNGEFVATGTDLIVDGGIRKYEA